jgi:hypothetical protein
MKYLLLILLIINCSVPSDKEKEKNELLLGLLLSSKDGFFSVDNLEISDIVVKRKLSWENFRGKTSSQQYGKNPASIAMYPMKRIDGNKTTVYCEMLEYSSQRQIVPLDSLGKPMQNTWYWKTGHHATLEDWWNYVLAHEQGHLDFCTKTLIEETKILVARGKNINDPKVLNEAYAKTVQKTAAYDDETSGGQIYAKQIEWLKKIEEM